MSDYRNYVSVPPARTADEALSARLLRFVEDNQLASMAGAFAFGVVLGVIARR